MSNYTIGLVGNPNAGKSSLFNCLTGLKQHTGNWSGKTVAIATGKLLTNSDWTLVDIPGIYSLYGLSDEEQIACDYIYFDKCDAFIIVIDPHTFSRGLNMVTQLIPLQKPLILVINMYDEVLAQKIVINRLGLCYDLEIPVCFLSVKKNIGFEELNKAINTLPSNPPPPLKVSYKKIDSLLADFMKKNFSYHQALILTSAPDSYFLSLKKHKEIEYGVLEPFIINSNDRFKNREHIIEENFLFANRIKQKWIKGEMKDNQKIDRYLTSKLFGIPLMFTLLFIVFYITIEFANYPSEFLFNLFAQWQSSLNVLAYNINMNSFLSGLLIDGVFHTTTWVIAVMLPPMAIFFPLFSLLEDSGFLPRIAFNLDFLFHKSCAHGKQCLSMLMGLGCNAAGVVSTRIIDTKRERLLAILTNVFVPCNGRFPTIILLSLIFFANTSSKLINSVIPALTITILLVIGFMVTLICNKLISKVLPGKQSEITLELPPLRRPNITKTLQTSFIDRTLFVLVRAVLCAAPFGALIYLLAGIKIGNLPLLSQMSSSLENFGYLIGLDGPIMLAFILGLPANEIVLPILLMIYSTGTSLIEYDYLSVQTILIANGWTLRTAICFLLFSLLHFPCATTLLTIKKETDSIKWTFISFILPTIIAFLICFLVNLLFF